MGASGALITTESVRQPRKLYGVAEGVVQRKLARADSGGSGEDRIGADAGEASQRGDIHGRDAAGAVAAGERELVGVAGANEFDISARSHR